MRKGVRFLIQLLFGLVLLFIWLRFIEWDLLLSYLSQIDLKYVGIAYLFGFSAGLLRFTRLKIVLAPLVKVPIVTLYIIGLAANLFNFLLAMRAGELTKGYYLKRLYDSSFVQATSAVVVDRVADFLILLFVIILIGTFGHKGYFSLLLLVALFFLPLLMLYLLAWKGTRLFSFFESLMLKFNLPFRDRILSIVEDLIKGFAVARRSPRTLFVIFFLSFLPVIVGAVGTSFMLRAFSVRSPILSVLLAISLFELSFLIPSPPAYIGTIEVAGSLIFALVLGLDKNLAASIALFFHIYSAFMVGIMGLPAVLYLHLRLLHGKHEAQNPKFETSTNAPNSKT